MAAVSQNYSGTNEFNFDFIIKELIKPKQQQLKRRFQEQIPSEYMLPLNLPSLARIEAVAQTTSIKTRKDEILKLALETALKFDSLPSTPIKKSKPTTSINSIAAVAAPITSGGSGWKGLNPNGIYEDWQVFKAIETKDLILLMEIRDKQFNLLVQPQKNSNNNTPITHAMRLGKNHKDVAILLTGAISRKVNDLTDEEISTMSSTTKSLLRSIRTNLKLAISYGLMTDNTDLLSSYLQISIMSEGTQWLNNATNTISLYLRSSNEGSNKPVYNTEKLFSKWVGKELKNGGNISSVEAYYVNAVCDLILMGLYSVVTDTQVGEPLPLWFFARDDRMSKAFDERLDELKKAGNYIKLSKTLRKQIEVTQEILSDRNIVGKKRLANLKLALD